MPLFVPMALINRDTVMIEVARILKKAPIHGGIEILSYKRNRCIALIKEERDQITVREDGYSQRQLRCDVSQLAKKLKPLLKYEFPRSRKVRLHKFQHYDELQRVRQKI